MQKLRPWLFELTWFILTGVLVCLIILPIRMEIYDIRLSVPRCILLSSLLLSFDGCCCLKSPFHKIQLFKVILGIGAIWVMLYSIRQFGLFQTFLDEKGIQTVTAMEGKINRPLYFALTCT